MLQGGLVGLGWCLAGGTGCQETESNLFGLPRVTEFVDRGYRLYGITTRPESHPAEVLAASDLQLLLVHWPRTWTYQKEPAMLLAVWATADEAEQLADVAEVASVFEKRSEHVAVVGSADTARPDPQSRGLLAVKLMPTPETHPQLDRPCAQTLQVVQAWRETFADHPAIVIHPGPKPVIPEDFGEVADLGQVLIRFSADELDGDVLDRILNHPQVVAIRWGGLFTHLHCPPCGMG